METLAEKSSFKKPLQHQRCIIPVSGFYEWKAEGKTKQPYYIHRADEQPLTFAGLWEHWVDKETGETIESCTIITTKANSQLEVIHDRMPVVLDYEKAKEWLIADLVDLELLKGILEHPGTVELEIYPVSDYVNSTRNEGEKCIERA
jgi:putative SOS response-associated peptidase YedK